MTPINFLKSLKLKTEKPRKRPMSAESSPRTVTTRKLKLWQKRIKQTKIWR
jgi:hypothetical protein